MSFSVNTSKLPRIRSFDDARQFFEERRFPLRKDPNTTCLTRRNDHTKVMIRSESDKAVYYEIKYHQTVMAQYSRGAHGDHLVIDSGHCSASDRAILHAVTPFSYSSFKSWTTFDIDGKSYVCDSMELALKESKWVIEDVHGAKDHYQLEVTGQLSKKRRELLDNITNYHRLTGKDKAPPTFSELVHSDQMLAFAQVLCAAPEEWPKIAKAVHPQGMHRLKRLLTITEGRVVKHKLPFGDLPRDCVYDYLSNYVPLVS